MFDQLLSLFPVALSIRLSLIDSIFFMDEMPAVKHTDHAELVVLKEVDELVDVEEEGCGLRLRIHIFCCIVAGPVEPAGHIDGGSLVAE